MAARLSLKRAAAGRAPGIVPRCAPLAALAALAAHAAALPVPPMDASLPLRPERRIAFDTDEATWISLDVAPDGRSVVFDILGDLYVVDAGGGEARAISSGPAFDAQPAFSPDGARVLFVSDRSGTENLWSLDAAGSDPRQLTFRDDHDTFVSPAWSADGEWVYASRHRTDVNGYELWRVSADGSGRSELIGPVKATPGQPRDQWRSTLGAMPSRDGRYLYYAAVEGEISFEHAPQWSVRRRDLLSGTEEVVVGAPRSPRPDLVLGSAFRPMPSPDGRLLVYGTRHDGQTGLRVLDLQTREDRWLSFPVQQDESMAFASRDVLPRYAFTPDGRALVIGSNGKLTHIDLASGRSETIPFTARVSQDLGPYLRTALKQETGPVRARLIQTPEQSPDGRWLAFSALGCLYVMRLDGEAAPRRLTQCEVPEFQPSWSPDGRTLVYITWTAGAGGHIWAAPAHGRARPRRLTTTPAFFTSPVFTPDARRVLAVRSSNRDRMGSYMEYGTLRQGELVSMPAAGGAALVVTAGLVGGKPHWGSDPARVYLYCGDGMNEVALDGSGRRPRFAVTGPGWYFAEGRAAVDDLRLSPDGRWALAQVAQQLYLLGVPAPPADATDVRVDIADTHIAGRRLTSVGADFFEWADGGRTITWAVGSTFYRRPLAQIAVDAAGAVRRDADAPPTGEGGVQAFRATVEVPRDEPRGALVLRGATAITLRGDEVIADADLVVVNGHIVGVGRRGEVALPGGATLRDVSGKYLVPGFIDAHDHLADIRRGVLDLEGWGASANLAYGVTTAFDPSPLSIDMLAYEDLLDSGRMIGSRVRSTGPALFSFNEFTSLAQVRSVLSRYATHYRTLNLKQYRTGNRRVRQWVAQAARELGMLPTSEGALSMKLDLAQIADGYAGTEHALTAVPLARDVVQFVAQSRVSYTPTLTIAHGGPPALDLYVARARPHDDAKLNRFVPHFVVDVKTLQRTWRDEREYLFPRIAESAARIVRAGGLLAVGSHGEMPGMGLHWEMQALASGGLTPLQVLRAATLGSAEAIGRQEQFGSLEPGKYADLVVLDRNPLADIAETLAIHQVMKNGRLYDGATLDEVWPRQRPLPRPWFRDDRPPAQ